ncbi:hypothetical protein BGZ58_007394 [Dissophora ornata]|nr:hypothetical protein BGZ58_007394 [Dissophora ornata]
MSKTSLAARNHSYSPHSKFRVGTAFRTTNGEVYQGRNVENASYGGVICVERTAFFMNEFGKTLEIFFVNDDRMYKRVTLEDLLPFAFGPEDIPDKFHG